MRCARALHAQGGEYGDAGAQLVMTVLGVDPGQGEALRQYARVAAERGLWGEVMKVGLRLVVVAPHDAEVHRLLAAAVAVSACVCVDVDVDHNAGVPAALWTVAA